MSRDVRSRDAYLVKSVVHSSRLLTAFRSPGEALPLKEISLRSGLPKTMAFRLLYTLEKCGMVERWERTCTSHASGPGNRSFIVLDTPHKGRTINSPGKC